MKSGFCDRWSRPWVLCSSGSNFFFQYLMDALNLVWATQETPGTRRERKVR